MYLRLLRQGIELLSRINLNRTLRQGALTRSGITVIDQLRMVYGYYAKTIYSFCNDKEKESEVFLQTPKPHFAAKAYPGEVNLGLVPNQCLSRISRVVKTGELRHWTEIDKNTIRVWSSLVQ